MNLLDELFLMNRLLEGNQVKEFNERLSDKWIGRMESGMDCINIFW